MAAAAAPATTPAPHWLDGGYAVGPQVRPAELEVLAAAGFRSLLCNRPDGEEPGQPAWAELAAAARRHGLVAACLPLDSSRVGAADAAAFARLREELPQPVFAFCRSGRRSAALWARALQGQRPLDDLLATARAAGFDLADVLRRPTAD